MISSKNIDERVVEMRFDNKQFESGVKETMGTLDRLKQALNLSSSKKSMENLDRAVQNVSFDQMAKSISSIERRFSAMGIVGMRVIQNLTDSAMGQFGRAANFVKQSVVSGGIRRAMNIENAHFQLQALLKDEKKVQAVMDDAMDAVDGTAYGFDEAARAASQFAASGLQAGEEMQRALKGITGVSAMTNREFSEIATIFTTVAGNGRLMGDQLLQFSDRGLNAASTLKDYFVEVKGLTSTTEQDIRAMVSEGEISFKTFAEAMGWAFGDSAKRANETFNGSLSNMKAALARIGAGFVSPLVEQNSNLILLFNAIKDRINDVKKALVFDEAIGNTEALSKQFTDSVLAMAEVTTNFLNNADLTKPLQIFYYGFESIKNVAKGSLSVLKPIASAFHDVFGLPTINDISSLVIKVEDITSKLKLTSKASDNLKTTFVGVFDILKLIKDGSIKFVEALIPIGDPASSAADQLLSLTATMGKVLSAFSKWVRESPQIAKGYNIVSKAISTSTHILSEAIRGIDRFLEKAYNLPEVQNFLSGIAKLFNALGTVSAPYVDYLSRKIDNFRASAMIMVPETVNKAINHFLKLIDSIGTSLNNLDLTKPIGWINSLGKSIKDTVNSFGSGNKKGFVDLFPFEEISEKIKIFKDTVGGFASWVSENFGNVFSDMSLGNAVAGGTGIAMVYSIVKLAKAVGGAINSFNSISDLFDAIGGTLESYQKSLDAKALKDIAIAIGIMAGSLFVLSLADTNKVTSAAIALGAVAAIIIFAVDKIRSAMKASKELTDAKNKSFGQNLSDALAKIGSSFSKGFTEFGKAAKWNQIASTIRSFGETLLMIVGAIAIVQLLNKKDPEGFKMALSVVDRIATVMLGIISVMTLVGSAFGEGMKSFKAAADGMRSLSLTILISTIALGRLMKMDLPDDYKTKLAIFAGLFSGVALLGVLIAKLSGDKKKSKFSATSILSLAAFLYATVEALNLLFKMDLPDDYGKKLAILAGIFGGMVLIIAALGKASGSKGSIKAAGTLLAFALDIVVIVGALMILSIMPGDKLLKGALALGAVIIALGKALSGVGKADNSNYKSILSMALMVGSIVAALAILSMISAENLLKSATALGSMLLVLAGDLYAIGKSSGGIDWKAIAALAAETAIIAASLYFLSDKSWDKLFAAAVALGGVLLSVAGTMRLIVSSGTPNVNQLTGFLLGVMAIIPIGLALNELAKNPWEQLLASSAAIGLVLLAIGETLNKVSTMSPPRVEAIGAFAAGVISIIPISIALNELAKNKWESLLAAGIAIAEVLVSLGTVLAICSAIGPKAGLAIGGIVLLDVLIADLAAVFTALGEVFEDKKLSGWLDNGVAVMEKLGNAIGGFIGGIFNGIIDSSTESLPDVGARLSTFMTNLEPFFAGISNIKEESLEKTTTFMQSLTTMCQSAQSLYSWLQTVDLDTFGTQMQNLGASIVDFAGSVGDIDEDSLKGAKSAAEIMAALVKAIPSEGGLKGFIFGDQDLGSFGEQLKALGQGLKTFATVTDGITDESVKGAAAAAGILSDLAHKIPSNGSSVVKWIIGEKDMGEFGKQLYDLGWALRSFCLVTNGITDENVKGAAKAIELMVDLSNKLPNTKSVVGFFTGDKQSLSDFGNNLIALGSALSQFTEYLKSTDLSGVDDAVTSIGKLVDVSNKIADSKYGSLSSLVYGMTDLGSAGIANLTIAFEDGTSKVIDSASSLMINVIAKLKEKLPDFTKIGSEMGQRLITAFSLKKASASSTAFSFVHAIISNIRNSLDSLYDIGKNGSEGFIRGFRSNMQSARKAGKDIGKATSDATKKALEERSPSKVMYKIGDYAGLGFVSGFLRYISKAEQAGYEVGDASTSGLNKAIENTLIPYDKLFKNPVIQPVVDSSKVYAAASEIDRMFNSSIHLQSNRLDGLNAPYNRSGIDDLLSAIKDLKGSEDDRRYGDTYTIGNITYEEGSNVGNAFKSLVRAIQLEGRA